MSRLSSLFAVLLLGSMALWTAEPARAQKPATKPPAGKSAPAAPPAKASSKPSPARPPTAIEPEASAAIERMLRYLRSLNAFTVQAETTIDQLMIGGSKIQSAATVDITVRRPDRMRMNIAGDSQDQQIFYDGTRFTLLDIKPRVYATAPAPESLDATLDMTLREYGMELPLAELLYGGTQRSMLQDVLEGIVVRTARIDGVECQQLAFHQEDVDWQIWIESGDKPLPRKLVITTLGERAQPQYTAVMRWNLAPDTGEALFTFDPPANAARIVFVKPEHWPREKRTIRKP
jgi:hypothetical protein